MTQPTASTTRRRAAVASVALLGATLLGACRGENLFSLAASAGETGPEVNVTQPGPGFTIAAGDSVQIQVEINAPAGLGSVAYSGAYVTEGTDAYLAETETFTGELTARITNYLQPVAGQVAGDVYIYVEATDRGGDVGRDSVRVQIIS